MFNFTTIKIVASLNVIVFVGLTALFYQATFKELESQHKDSTHVIDMVKTSIHMQRFLIAHNKESSDELSEEDALQQLRGFALNTAKVKTDNLDLDYLNKKVSEVLAKNQLPDDALLTEWTSTFMLETIVQQVKDQQKSEVSLAPAIILTDRKWTFYTYGAILTGMLLTFWLGCLFAYKSKPSDPAID